MDWMKVCEECTFGGGGACLLRGDLDKHWEEELRSGWFQLQAWRGRAGGGDPERLQLGEEAWRLESQGWGLGRLQSWESAGIRSQASKWMLGQIIRSARNPAGCSEGL